MTRLSEQIAEDQSLAASTQAKIRNNRRVVRRNLTPAIATTGIYPQGHDENHDDVVDPIIPEPALPADPAPSSSSMTISHPAITLSPLDLPADQFRAGLDRRKQNRQLLMDWLRSALVEGVDFGPVHIAGKDKCDLARSGRAKECQNQYHWSKPSLFKPGAEKITGMLGMTVHYPSLVGYENAFLSGQTVTQVMLRCELHDAHGRVVAEGVGARHVSQDFDLNKSLKMAEKSAHIDATLRLAGLSEVFTQDVEDFSSQDSDNLPPPPRATSPQRTTTPRPRPPRQARPAAPPADNGFSSPTPASPAPAATTPVSPVALKGENAYDLEIIGPDDVAWVKARVVEIGIAEKRVLAWLYKVTKGTVTRFEQLNVTQCNSLLKRLDSWAEEASAQTPAAA
ncbi:MAG: hypothetical protein NTV11_10040 [Rhodocyclales bacterium]|nr:hypothetical protein [Rhodocyclales bacterium]